MSSLRSRLRSACRAAVRVGVLPLLTAACADLHAPTPEARMPVVPLPSAYHEAFPAEATNPPPADHAPAGTAWWHAFGSAELDGLIDRALANNPDMRIAVQHIIQTQARLAQARATRLPTLSAPLVVGDQSGGATSVGAAPTGSVSGSSGSQKTWQAGVRADWRLDLWNEQSALAASARFQLEHAIQERANVERNLTAAVAGSYVELLSLNDRRRIAEDTEKLQQATLRSVERRVAAGDATLADLEQQRAAISSVHATLPVLEQQRHEAASSLAFLVGTVPGALQLSGLGLDSLRLPAGTRGLPSELLLRRPDLRMAEAQLRAARADVAVARARLLPPMDLAAQLGRSAASPAQLLQPQTLFWSVVDSLTVTLFDGGRRHNDEVFSRAVEEELVESYVRTVHQAVREVENALAALRLAGERAAAEHETLEAARRAMEISTRIYQAGGVDYLTLLDTQRTWHRYQDEVQQARVAQFQAQIALFQALAGDMGGPPRAADEPAASTGERIRVACLAGLPGDDGQPDQDGDWQVELPGDYHCATVAPAWRDLQLRHPEAMQARVLRPTLAGRIEDRSEDEQSWFHLAISRFPSRAEADALCAALQADQMRCSVRATPATQVLGTHAPRAAAPKTAAATTAVDPRPSASPAGAPGSRPPGLQIEGFDETGIPVQVGDGTRDDMGTSPSGAVAAAAGPPRPDPGAGTESGAAGRYLQLGAFRDPAHAEALRAAATAALRDARTRAQVRRDGSLSLVWVGPFADAQGERAAAARLRGLAGGTPRSVRAPVNTAGGP